jgi:hypothetical protein
MLHGCQSQLIDVTVHGACSMCGQGQERAMVSTINTHRYGVLQRRRTLQPRKASITVNVHM